MVPNAEEPYDEYKWSLRNAEALRVAVQSGDFSSVDMDRVIREVGGLASGLRLELYFDFYEILLAIVVSERIDDVEEKERLDRQRVRAQGDIQLLLSVAPSLRDVMDEVLTEAYEQVKTSAVIYELKDVPEKCPVPLEKTIEFV